MLVTVTILLGLSAIAGLDLARAPGGVENIDVDVELVLAVDVSRSMDFEEVRIQREGYLAALRHPDFINAVQAGLLGRIAITYYEWAGSVDLESVLDWQVIETTTDAEFFANQLEARPIATQRRTSISAAITQGMAMINSNQFEGMRRIIDVSGDGPNNIGEPVVPARDEAIAAGIVVNGLAIMLRPSGMSGPLDQYYANCVIGGPGSFVLPVHRTEDFAVAVRRKLILEISGNSSPRKALRIASQEEEDCLVGERQWQYFLDR